ncbi:ABC transporter ATP-binding protein [Roseiarcaceae bacterium H3SJ34-1]|uniref:ABC transporter ATP-binding protein n=1 Tax=Terripilifer ovatus TaxID=3032367 RepID=UPI003AB94426|nr:ABC transporter ATP-binding protein [Roseiarcaceae bacterium H3SJ34-1]
MTPALDIRNVSRRFGGLLAVDDVSFSVAQGGLSALIGPNGAGKTTLFNCVTNLFPPTAGSVRFFGQPLARLDGHRIAELGLVRTFQTARVFPGMTVLENALCGAQMHVRTSPLAQMFRTPGARSEERRLRDKAEALLDLIGLTPFSDAAATDLPMGAQKNLEVVRALMSRPRMLLLDEPAAGLNDSETADLAALLTAIRDVGITIMVVEHNMSLVMGIADQVIVLDAGKCVAIGAPAAIQSDPKVINAYVGSDG